MFDEISFDFQAVHFATGALLHDCATCGRVFTSKTTLKRHAMTHLTQGTEVCNAPTRPELNSVMFFQPPAPMQHRAVAEVPRPVQEKPLRRRLELAETIRATYAGTAILEIH